MNEHELKIKELRTIEAMERGYCSATGKIATIARYSGSPIIGEVSGDYITTNFIDDYWYDIDQTETNALPTKDVDNGTPYSGVLGEYKNLVPSTESIIIGWHVDYLNRGINMQITFYHEDTRILVIYNGIKVYEEIAGDLKRFVPSKDWENIIESKQDQVKLNYQDEIKEKKEIKKQKTEASLGRIFKDLRDKWGI